MPRVGDSDVLQRHHSVRLEQRVELAAIRGEVAVAERFHHFDGDDLVELAIQPPVVLQQDVHAVRDALALEALLGEIKLRLRDGDGRDAAAVRLHRVAREAAPAAADFQHVVAALDVEFAAKCVVFFKLRDFQRVVRRGENGAAVSHRGVEPELVKLVPEVVMLGDILLCSAHAIWADKVGDAVGKFQHAQRERADFRAGHRGGVFDVQHGPRDDALDAVRLPLAIDVAFTKPDITKEHAALEKSGIADAYPSADFRSGSSKVALRAIGQFQHERASSHLAHCIEHEPLEKTGRWFRGGGGGEGFVHGAFGVIEECGLWTSRCMWAFAPLR